MLPCEPRHAFLRIPLCRRTMARRAQSLVDRHAVSAELAIAPAGVGYSRQTADIGCDIGQILGTGEVMRLRNSLHAHIPTFAVVEVNKLTHDNAPVLSSDRRDVSIARAAAIGGVASDAYFE